MFGNYIKLAGTVLAVCLVLVVFFSVTACAPKKPVKYLALSFDDGPNLTNPGNDTSWELFWLD